MSVTIVDINDHHHNGVNGVHDHKIFEGPSFEVKEGNGLLIQLHSDDGAVTMTSVPDQKYEHIHPNCYAPACMDKVRLLHGGGSGTAVFGGIYHHDPQRQQPSNLTPTPIVMKHGGPKDTKEVFSLATITAELMRRRSSSEKAEKAYYNMKRKIPEFVGVYISPHHLRDRGKELWCSVRSLIYTPSGTRLSILGNSNRSLGKSDRSGDGSVFVNSTSSSKHSTVSVDPPPRALRVLFGHKRSAIYWDINHTNVDIHVPTLHSETDNVDCANDGIEFIQRFGDELQKQEQKHEWKVTLMQKWIGGMNAINGADVLTSGHLTDQTLDTLILEFTDVMEDLDDLTLPQEREGHLDAIRNEIEELRVSKDIRLVSKSLDRFVGRSILKNFHPDHGRFRNLRLIGEDIQDDMLVLTMAEMIPAEFLGKMLEPNVPMHDVFIDPPCPRMALDIVEETGWFSILEEAIDFQNKASFHVATDCLWTCGLTDAGLHNCFLSVERGLEMFDLGEPTLEPRPAFLTKFLMSFFHTLGMESNGPGGVWKNRFEIVQGPDDNIERLSLTLETKEKIPYLVNVFNTTVDHIIKTVFYDDVSVRQLMLKYVVMQLLSDASFCLQRWEAKGGGAERFGERSKEPLEKWLWRTLWDCYIASFVQSMMVQSVEST